MTDPPSKPTEPDADFAVDIGTDVARPARIHNYLAGGAGNFTVDRRAADYLADVLPGGVETARATVQALAGFVERVVRYLVDEQGVRQLLYIGAAVPGAGDVHEIAQRCAPESRVVYVGSDPVVLAHAHTLRRTSTPEGAAAYVHGTLRDIDRLLDEAGATLDLTRPVGVLLPVTLSFVPDKLDPHGIVARLLAALASGSQLAVAHTTNDIPTEGMAEAAKRLSEAVGPAYVVRTQAEISRFFDGLDVVEPGLVQIDEWHPADDGPAQHDGLVAPILGAVALKP